MIGTILKNRFLLESELGRGGMGAVYKANDQILERSVAIKVLKDLSGEDVGRKLRLEAQILARLLHENIVRLYDFDEQDGTYYFIMEEVDGTSFFKRWKQLTVPERLTILAPVADALDYAHHQGVIHRDIKPGNILLTSKDQPKLSDFGLSLISTVEQETGVARGTPTYMSPEQAKGMRLDHRTDLYSLGVILYECATGDAPFQGPPMAVMAQHVNNPPQPPHRRNPELSPALSQLILRLLSKNPESRPGSGKVVAQALRELLEGERWRSSPATLGEIPDDALESAEISLEELASRERFTTVPRRAAGAPISAGGLAERWTQRMVEQVESEPIALNPEQRYLTGHYLAYLLGGSRRRGFFLRRPLDPLNADRARLILAMAWLMNQEKTGKAEIRQAARLLDEQPDVRPLLSPITVMKYLACRDSAAKRKRFRQVRQELQQASEHARKHMTDERGNLNPGLMPQTLDDLMKVAPKRTELDDQLVHRWNRVAEVWRSDPKFRIAVLRYATQNAANDPVSIDLWPEVVYPLIERARWQRRRRSGAEAFWDALSGNVLGRPDAGVRLDRALKEAVPSQVVEELDLSLQAFQDDPERLDALIDAQEVTSERSVTTVRVSAATLQELASEEPVSKDFVRLAEPDPLRFNVGELRELWKEALEALKSQGARGGHQTIPVGPYRLAVIASIRSHKAGTIALQGMPNKQIEILVPPFTGGGGASKPILAVWIYQNRSLVITYLDSRNTQRYILWDAATNVQTNFDDPAQLNHNLLQRSMEAPDQLSKVLSKSFRPSNAV